MKKVIGGILVLAVVAISLTGCTEQRRAREFGGNATVELPAGTKLVTVTWKEASIWYLTRPMNPDEKPETYTFTESSSWGVIEGKVLIVEK